MSDMRMTRRAAVAAMAGAAGAALAGAGEPARGAQSATVLKGRIRQSVSRWCYGGVSLDDLCVQAKAMGLVGIDLLGENEWDTVKRHGLLCTMASQIGTIKDCWNRLENHDRLLAESDRLIRLVAKAGLPNLITFSGNRGGLADAQGLDNCAAGITRIIKLAEDQQVTVCMELLNSKRNHKDYQCDHITWGVELVKRIGSPRFKLLYDIYHMQIMEGDVCATVSENITHIAHFHTGGVPGRHEIDETQELNYTRVCQAIADAGFQGVVAHEFVPHRPDIMESLRQAVRICDV